MKFPRSAIRKPVGGEFGLLSFENKPTRVNILDGEVRKLLMLLRERFSDTVQLLNRNARCMCASQR